MTSPQAGSGAQALTVADIVAAVEASYDPSLAADWDAVGLVCGDPSARVDKVLLAVDPVADVVEEALEWGADLLLTHHPLLLRGVTSVAADTAKGALVHRLVRGGCALLTAHTNADAAAPGVSDALARVVGLDDLVPLQAIPADPLDKVVTFVPPDDADALVDALAAAGAGEIGDYTRCAWTSTGTGTFTPGDGASPAVGSPDEVSTLVETRVEMVAPRGRRAAVLAALRTAHPYEEPAFDVLELASWSSPRGIGRVGRLAAPITLQAFVSRVAQALPATVQGVRAAGPAGAVVERVAVCGGAGDTLLDAVRTSGADVYLTADLRHHPASEVRESAGAGPPYLVDVSHWASEWPWLAGCANRLAVALAPPGSEDPAAGPEMRISLRRSDPWTLHAASPFDPGTPR